MFADLSCLFLGLLGRRTFLSDFDLVGSQIGYLELNGMGKKALVSWCLWWYTDGRVCLKHPYFALNCTYSDPTIIVMMIICGELSLMLVAYHVMFRAIESEMQGDGRRKNIGKKNEKRMKKEWKGVEMNVQLCGPFRPRLYFGKGDLGSYINAPT